MLKAITDPYLRPDPHRSVLLTIDVQNDFTLPGAVAEIAGTWAAVPRMEQLVRTFRTAGRPIVHVVRLYLPDGSNVDSCRRLAIEQGRRVVTPGSAGARLVNALLPSRSDLDAKLLLSGQLQPLGPNEWAMYKSRWRAFHTTGLEATLNKWSVNTVVVCGCNFPNCPRTTAYDATQRDLRVVLVRDATSGLYERGEAELAGIGVHVTEAETVVDWLTSPRHATAASTTT